VQFYNPGYEHLKAIYLLKKAQAKAPLQDSSVYILPLMALQSACRAIEEYVNLTGRKVDPIWDETNWSATSLQEKIACIYKKIGQIPHFKKGIWKDVSSLFETTGLIEGNLFKMQQLQKEEIPRKLKSIAVEYPIYRSQAVAEEAIDLLLDISDIKSSVRKNVSLTK